MSAFDPHQVAFEKLTADDNNNDNDNDNDDDELGIPDEMLDDPDLWVYALQHWECGPKCEFNCIR